MTISGEFHYWRNNKEHWQTILDSILEMGLDTIATYVPWQFHEKKQDEFDFSLLEEFRETGAQSPGIVAVWRGLRDTGEVNIDNAAL